jgi:hypothetical protein
MVKERFFHGLAILILNGEAILCHANNQSILRPMREKKVQYSLNRHTVPLEYTTVKRGLSGQKFESYLPDIV